MSGDLHQIKRSIVRTGGAAVQRVRCSCGDFQHDAPRLSTPGRRKLDRLISEHMVSANAGAINVALDIATRNAFEAPL